MAQDELERALRDMLSQRVADSRSPQDPASVAIRRGRRLRRFQTTGGIASAALAIVLVSVGIVQLGAPTGSVPAVVVLDNSTGASELPFGPASPEASPVTAPSAAPAGVELISGNVLTGDQRVEFPLDNRVTAALRTADGWLLVTTSDERFALWFGTASGQVRRLISNAGRLVLAPNGQRVAWRDGDRLFTSSVSHGDLGRSESVPGMKDAEPVRFLGSALLLRRAEPAGFRLWSPSGDLPGSWQSAPLDIYGLLPDGRTAVGTIRNALGVPCLALLDLGRNLTPTDTSCTAQLAAGPATVSPDGRWLLANAEPAPASSADPEEAVLVDLQRAFGPTRSLWSAGPALTGAPDWVDDHVAVRLDSWGHLVVLSTKRVVTGGEVDRLPLGDGGESGTAVLVTHATPSAGSMALAAPTGTSGAGS